MGREADLQSPSCSEARPAQGFPIEMGLCEGSALESAPALGPSRAMTKLPIEQRAKPAAGMRLPLRDVFDAHVDSLQRALDLGHDLGTRTAGHLDLVRAREGGLAALVLVCWVDPVHHNGRGGAARRARALLREGQRLFARHPEQVRFAGNGRMLAEARAAGLVAAVPGIEGGHAIEGDLGQLERFFAQGVRVLTLVWNNHLPWIRSCQAGAGPDTPAGLSALGREIVRRMNELGMVVDLSHAGERSFFDALEVSSKPVLASHSGCSALHDHPRNLSDDQLRALAANGGVVGIAFYPSFLDAEARAASNRVRASEEFRSLTAENGTALFLRQTELMRARVEPLALARVADHVLHAIEVAGIEHVGIGSDFDGIEDTPAELHDATGYPALANELARRGLGEAELEAVLGANVRRVFEAVTDKDSAAWTAELELLP